MFRVPDRALENKRACGYPFKGNGGMYFRGGSPKWLLGPHRPPSPFHPFIKTPPVAVFSTLPAQGWKHARFDTFSNLWDLWVSKRAPYVAYALKRYVLKPVLSLAKYFYITNCRPGFFDTKRYISYFT
jgi:hypothetical protein